MGAEGLTTSNTGNESREEMASLLQEMILPEPHLTFSTMQSDELTIVSLGHAYKAKNHAKKYLNYVTLSSENDGHSNLQKHVAYAYMIDYKALRKYKDRLYEMVVQKGSKGPRFVINDISPGKRWKQMAWKDSTPTGVLEKMLSARLKTKEKDRTVNGNEFFGFETRIVALALREWYEIQHKGEPKFQNRDAEQWMDLLLRHDEKLAGNIEHYEEKLQFLKTTLREREKSHIFTKPKLTPPVEKSREYGGEMEELLNEDLLQSNLRSNVAERASSVQKSSRRETRTTISTTTLNTSTKNCTIDISRDDFHEEVVILAKSPSIPVDEQQEKGTPTVVTTATPSQLLDELASITGSGPNSASSDATEEFKTHIGVSSPTAEETPQRKRPPIVTPLPQDFPSFPASSAMQFKRPSAVHRNSIDSSTAAFLSPIDHVPPRKSIEPSRKSSSLTTTAATNNRKRRASPSSLNTKALKKKRVEESPIKIDTSSSDEATPEKLSPNPAERVRRTSLIPPLNLDESTHTAITVNDRNNNVSPQPPEDSLSPVLDNLNTPEKSFTSRRSSTKNVTADDLLNSPEIASPKRNKSTRSTSVQSPEVFSEDSSQKHRHSHKGSSSPDLFSEDDNHTESDMDTQDDSVLDMHPSTAPTQSPMANTARSLPIRYSAIPKHPITSVSKESPICMKETITVHADPIDKICLAPLSVMVGLICGRTEILIYSSDGRHLKLRHRLRKSGEEYLNIAFTPDEQYLVIHGSSLHGKAHFLRFVSVDEGQVDMDECMEIVEYNDKIESFIPLRAAPDSISRHCLFSLQSKIVKQCTFNETWSKEVSTMDIGYHNSPVKCLSQVNGDQFLNLIVLFSDTDVCVWNTFSESLKVLPRDNTRFLEMHAFVSNGTLLLLCLCLDQDDVRKVACYALDDEGLKKVIIYDVNVPREMTPLPSLYQDRSEKITCIDFCMAHADKKYYVPVGTQNGLVYILNATAGVCVGILKDHLSSLYQPSGFTAQPSTQNVSGCIRSCLFHRRRALLVVACERNLFVYAQPS